MALSTFTPPVAQSPGMSLRTDLKLLEAEFGDGYTQSGPDGLNYIRDTVSISWDALTDAQRTTINSFFRGLGGHTPFYYQPPGYTAAVKWTCKMWDSKRDSGFWKMTAELKQSFDTRT
ncbi:MAG: phage tail protein [Undibacterium sp.]